MVFRPRPPSQAVHFDQVETEMFALLCVLARYLPVFEPRGRKFSGNYSEKFSVVKDGSEFECFVLAEPVQVAPKVQDEIAGALLARLQSEVSHVIIDSPVSDQSLLVSLAHFNRVELVGRNVPAATVLMHAMNGSLKKQRLTQSIPTPGWEKYGIGQVLVEYACERQLDGEVFAWRFSHWHRRLTLKYGSQEVCHLGEVKGPATTRIECIPA